MLQRSVFAAASLASVCHGQLVTQPLVDLDQFKEELRVTGLQAEAPVTPGKLSSPTLCDSTVKQHSGYLNVAPDSDYFFWMFESRREPSKDPVILWLTGGPGCSSQLAALRENGPCNIFEDGNVTRNEHSWNNKNNIIYVDQPSGTGFSTGDATTHDEDGVATKMHNFMQEFYKALPQFKDNDFYIFGESYAGHYVPAVGHYIWKQGKAGAGFKVPLRGVAVGNGLTDPEEQYKWYPDMAKDGGKSEGGSLAEGVITNFIAQAGMRAAAKYCTGKINACNAKNDTSSCRSAYATCNYGELVPYQMTGYNPYDMRIKCEKPPLCYNFDTVEAFLNAPETQKQLGVTKTWASCNMQVNAGMQGDYMRNYHTVLPDMLADGVKVLIYAGDVDYICNWLGNKKWTLGLEWPHKAAFNAAKDESFVVDGKAGGRIRHANGFHFMQIYLAGHMAPMDQPAVVEQMVNDFVSGQLGSSSVDNIVV
eukprot:TRINITY_DN66049_c0_g1_i1.p1 TRINITY_DN66049_c0_g1~~TRINITY_DN66049_c0_g1_i1.p1  ORF type:complete len:503 (+),score=134.05 TRINITY_DN66049_c0_g1_i1:77-1510(+)